MKFSTLTLITLLTAFTSCSKEDVTPVPVETPTPITTAPAPTQDCSTVLLCLQDDWRLDSTIQRDGAGQKVMMALPSFSAMGLILRNDLTATNNTVTGTYDYNSITNWLAITNAAAASGTPTISGEQMTIRDTLDGVLGNFTWTDQDIYYSRR
jgi:hypothetical protein